MYAIMDPYLCSINRDIDHRSFLFLYLFLISYIGELKRLHCQDDLIAVQQELTDAAPIAEKKMTMTTTTMMMLMK